MTPYTPQLSILFLETGMSVAAPAMTYLWHGFDRGIAACPEEMQGSWMIIAGGIAGGA